MSKIACTSFQWALEQHRCWTTFLAWGAVFFHADTASYHVALASPHVQHTPPPPAVPKLGLGQPQTVSPQTPHPPRGPPRPPHHRAPHPPHHRAPHPSHHRAPHHPPRLREG
jgi:hypothetical protein